MAADGDWISWTEAAELVGCPVPTIDWHARLGRIEKRPHRGARPTLRRSSVIAFANWYHQRARQREDKKRERARSRERRRPTPPGEAGWSSTDQAAESLGVSLGHVSWLISRGHLTGALHRGRWWVRTDSLETLASFRSNERAWVSAAVAAELVGCSAGTILRAAERGEVEQRAVPRSRPSISRASVLRFRSTWRAREARRAAPPARPRSAPPDDVHRWLTTVEAAAELGLGVSRVNQLAREELVPAVRRGARFWYREDHLRVYVAAKRAQLSREVTAMDPLVSGSSD